ncbi:MAG: hypothetical protein JNK27_04680 [Chitinophagaceae bacterium]|nr:hypothetical protein [Chitinophagaceae bacterium]
MKLISRIILLLLMCSIGFTAYTQQVVLQRNNKKQKQVVLKKGTGSVFYTSKGQWTDIIATTDSTLVLSRIRKTERDSVYTWHVGPSRKHPDGTLSKTRKIWVRDTAVFNTSDILFVKRPLIKKRGWAVMPAWFIAGAILAIPLLPVAAIDQGSAGVRNWLQFEAILLGVSGPSLLLLKMQKKYVIGKKWALHLQ